MIAVTETKFEPSKSILAVSNHHVVIATDWDVNKHPDLAVLEDGRLIVKAGTLYPNESLPIGLVFQDKDITDGDVTLQILIHGFVKRASLPEIPSPMAMGQLPDIMFVPPFHIGKGLEVLNPMTYDITVDEPSDVLIYVDLKHVLREWDPFASQNMLALLGMFEFENYNDGNPTGFESGGVSIDDGTVVKFTFSQSYAPVSASKMRVRLKPQYTKFGHYTPWATMLEIVE